MNKEQADLLLTRMACCDIMFTSERRIENRCFKKIAMYIEQIGQIGGFLGFGKKV